MRRGLTIAAVVGLLALLVSGATARASTWGTVTSAARSAPPGLPDDGPGALYAVQRPLPTAAGWPGAEAFPRTSGTGRLADGGFYWTDFMYDDHGAIGASTGELAEQAGTPSHGTYTYPAGPAHDNGADLFGAAVKLTGDATYWQVRWTTLADARVPIAEWAIDRDAKATTGVAAWPAGAAVSSPGIDTAIVMSSRGAEVIDAATSRVFARAPVTVDLTAQSFVARIPIGALRPAGAWRVRLAAGLADGAGLRFASPQGALPGEAAIYNVTFRGVAQEPPSANFWDDNLQSRLLTTGDVSSISAVVDWSALARKQATPEPQPKGWSARWYVSSISLGAGIQSDAATAFSGDPEFLGAVQPYAVYVPHSYTPARGAPLTLLLHSSTQNHNQYAATTPRLTDAACERRQSICVAPLGRGPEGDFWDDAELDFWQVWHDAAAAYAVDPDRTVLVGYSMGGLAVNQLAMAHPDLFARAISLAGGVGEVPQAVNLRWVPTYLAGGAPDELVPVTLEKAEADQLGALGYRYRWLLYPAEDHVSFELKDGFSDACAYMGNAVRVTNPGHVTFLWSPYDTRGDANNNVVIGPQGHLATTQQSSHGVGTTGAYWLRDLLARSTKTDAEVDAVSAARPDRAFTPVTTHGVLVPGDPSPAIVTEQTWRLGTAAAAGSTITLNLTNVAALDLLLGAAGFAPGQHGVLLVRTDGPVTIGVGGHHVRVDAPTAAIPF